MTYRTHQRRLMPLLARTYALSASQQTCLVRCCTRASPPTDVIEEDAAAARVTGRRSEGAGDLARDRDDPDLPRGLRRRGLSGREPVRGAQGRHRRVHDVRGRQHRPAAAGRQGPADPVLSRASTTSTRSGSSASSPTRPSSTVVERDRAAPARRTSPGRGSEQGRRRRPPRPAITYARLFRWREEHIRAGLARRLKRGVDEGRPAFDVFAELPGPRGRAGACPCAAPRATRRSSPSLDRADEQIRPVLRLLARCTRSPRSRPTAPGSSSTAGSRPSGPRRSRPWSVGCVRGCAGGRGADRRLRHPRGADPRSDRVRVAGRAQLVFSRRQPGGSPAARPSVVVRR